MSKPVFFFNYANDPIRPLINVTYEDNTIRKIFAPFEKKDQIRFINDSIATLNKVCDTLGENQNLVGLFHYSGHANNKRLIFRNKSAHASGLAKLLGAQQNLQLVFLNGCSTYGQVQALLDEGVPLVIATSTKVSDTRSAEFAISFYKRIADGYTIEDAFNFAKGELEVNHKPHYSTIKFRDLADAKKAPISDEAVDIPWGLYASEKADLKMKLIDDLINSNEDLEEKNIARNLKVDAEGNLNVGDNVMDTNQYKKKNAVVDSVIKIKGDINIGDRIIKDKSS